MFPSIFSAHHVYRCTVNYNGANVILLVHHRCDSQSRVTVRQKRLNEVLPVINNRAAVESLSHGRHIYCFLVYRFLMTTMSER